MARKKNFLVTLTAFFAGWKYPIMLIIVIAIGFLMRFQNPNSAIGPCWCDTVEDLLWAKDIVNWHKFDLIFFNGCHEPFYAYFLAMLQWLFPNFKGLLIQRIGCTGIDLATIYFLYLTGKEIGDRRIGILVSAMAAISQPLIIQCILGMRIVALPLAVSLILWTMFRLFNKPSMGRFLVWGLSIGIGLYTYTAFRPLFLFLPFITIGWILLKDGKNSKNISFLIFVPCLLFLHTLIFIYTNGFFPRVLDVFFYYLINFTAILSILILCISIFLALMYRPQKEKKLFWGWIGGMCILGLSSYPLITHPLYSKRVMESSLFLTNDAGPAGIGILPFILEKIPKTLMTIFISGPDRQDMNIPGRGFFEMSFSILALLSIAYFLINLYSQMMSSYRQLSRRRNRILVIPIFLNSLRAGYKKGVSPSSRFMGAKLILLFLTIVGITPNLLSSDPHSGRLMACVPCLLLFVSIVAIEWMDKLFLQLRRAKIIFIYGTSAFIYAGMLALNFINIWGIYRHQDYNDVVLANIIEKYSKANRVYLSLYPERSNFFFPETQSVLNEGKDIYLLNSRNLMPIHPGEEGKNLVVLISGLDTQLFNEFKNNFPESKWTTIPYPISAINQYFYHPGTSIFAFLGQISFEEICHSNNNEFIVKKIPYNGSVRKYYFQNGGLAYGLVHHLQIAESKYEPFNPYGSEKHVENPPNDENKLLELLGSVKYEEQFCVPRDGKYVLILKTSKRTEVLLDSQRIFNVYPESTQSFYNNNVYLRSGKNILTIATEIAPVTDVPLLSIKD